MPNKGFTLFLIGVLTAVTGCTAPDPIDPSRDAQVKALQQRLEDQEKTVEELKQRSADGGSSQGLGVPPISSTEKHIADFSNNTTTSGSAESSEASTDVTTAFHGSLLYDAQTSSIDHTLYQVGDGWSFSAVEWKDGSVSNYYLRMNIANNQRWARTPCVAVAVFNDNYQLISASTKPGVLNLEANKSKEWDVSFLTGRRSAAKYYMVAISDTSNRTAVSSVVAEQAGVSGPVLESHHQGVISNTWVTLPNSWSVRQLEFSGGVLADFVAKFKVANDMQDKRVPSAAIALFDAGKKLIAANDEPGFWGLGEKQVREWSISMLCGNQAEVAWYAAAVDENR